MKVNLTEMKVAEKREFIKKLVEDAGSKFITLEFVKADGTNRSMNIQNAALKNHIKGNEASDSAKKAVATRKANNPHLLPVYDVQKHEIRSVNLDTVHTIRAEENEYTFG